MNDMEITIFVDGSVRKASQADSRGAGKWRFIAMTDAMRLMEDHTEEAANQTVPETELKALRSALSWLQSTATNKSGLVVWIFCDSELVVRWMSGAYAVRAENILPLYADCKARFAVLMRLGCTIKVQKISGRENMAHVEA